MSELRGPATLSEMLRRPHTIVGLMLTVPFALLNGSSSVSVSTRLWEDGTTLRQVTATAETYNSRNLPEWTGDVDAGADWQCLWHSGATTDGSATVTRNFVISQMDSAAGILDIRDVRQDPLNIFSTYTLTETVSIHHHYADDPAKASAGDTMLIYRVQMPGAIVDASAVPISRGGVPDIRGDSVSFSLDAAVPEHQVTVVARKVRWTYLIIALYVLGFIIYQGAAFVRRNVSSRPKRI